MVTGLGLQLWQRSAGASGERFGCAVQWSATRDSSHRRQAGGDRVEEAFSRNEVCPWRASENQGSKECSSESIRRCPGSEVSSPRGSHRCSDGGRLDACRPGDGGVFW